MKRCPEMQRNPAKRVMLKNTLLSRDLGGPGVLLGPCARGSDFAGNIQYMFGDGHCATQNLHLECDIKKIDLFDFRIGARLPTGSWGLGGGYAQRLSWMLRTMS